MARPRMALHVASSCARRGRAAFASWPALARALSTTSSSVEHAFKSNPHEDVPLLQRQPEPAASVPAERLFTQNQPGALSAEDLNRFYELDVATLEKHFPEGVNVGVHREFRATNLAALLVRQCTLDACALLESMRDDADALARTAAVVIDGPRGVGKSALLTSLVHACRASGWLVLSIPSAHVYLNSAPTIAQLSGARVEMSSTGRDDLAELCDVTGSTMGVMRGLLAAHDDALLELPAKCAETAAFADESGVRLENLNDLAQLGATDEALAPHALTLALRELREVDARPVAIVLDDANAFEHGTVFVEPESVLPLDASRFLLPRLLPSPVEVGSQLKRGLVLSAESATCTFQPQVKSRRLKKRQRQRLRGTWGARAEADGEEAPGVRRITVPPYSPAELEAMLSYYMHTGTWRPMPDLSLAHSAQAVLEQVHLITASNGEQVRRLCSRQV